VRSDDLNVGSGRNDPREHAAEATDPGQRRRVEFAEPGIHEWELERVKENDC